MQQLRYFTTLTTVFLGIFEYLHTVPLLVPAVQADPKRSLGHLVRFCGLLVRAEAASCPCMSSSSWIGVIVSTHRDRNFRGRLTVT